MQVPATIIFQLNCKKLANIQQCKICKIGLAGSYQTKSFSCNPVTVLTANFTKEKHKVLSLFQFQVFLQTPTNHLHFRLQGDTPNKYKQRATSQFINHKSEDKVSTKVTHPKQHLMLISMEWPFQTCIAIELISCTF